MMTNNSFNISQAKIDALGTLLMVRLEDLFSELNLDVAKSSRMFSGVCPIHGGDNPTALVIYRDGYSLSGYWNCQTHECHKIFKPTIIGFVRGVLSAREGWSENDGREANVYGFMNTINWICKFLGQDINKIEVDSEDVEKKRFCNSVDELNKSTTESICKIPRNIIRSALQIPAEFYLKRGFSEKILNNYDVGLSTNIKKPMFNRVVVPIFDNDGQFVVGWTGRTIYEKCVNCNTYHHSKKRCPTTLEEKKLCCKWKNDSNTNTSYHLYNYWNAKSNILRTTQAVLVEGPPDVWKLEEAGIHNAVALFGVNLTDRQKILLEKSGAMELVVLLDNDEAGARGIKAIQEECYRQYKISCPKILSKKDPGDMTIEEINQQIVPILKKG